MGFSLTIYLTIKTKNIDKQLKHRDLVRKYNSERKGLVKKFTAHRKLILQSKFQTRETVSDILTDLEAYSCNYSKLFSLSQKIEVLLFRRLLRKDYGNIKFNRVSQSLSMLIGRLSKEEDL